uniref:DUF5405 domain-containing protein n=1 Tax=viral metagenome TaxID=1070528 RepID=A0A6M3LLR1_9ZZZZ
MEIGKKYKVESDALNVTLSKRMTHKKTGAEYWSNIAYYSSIAGALQHLVDLEVKETGLKDLATVVTKQAELYKLIDSLKLVKGGK